MSPPIMWVDVEMFDNENVRTKNNKGKSFFIDDRVIYYYITEISIMFLF